MSSQENEPKVCESPSSMISRLHVSSPKEANNTQRFPMIRQLIESSRKFDSLFTSLSNTKQGSLTSLMLQQAYVFIKSVNPSCYQYLRKDINALHLLQYESLFPDNEATDPIVRLTFIFVLLLYKLSVNMSIEHSPSIKAKLKLFPYDKNLLKKVFDCLILQNSICLFNINFELVTLVLDINTVFPLSHTTMLNCCVMRKDYDRVVELLELGALSDVLGTNYCNKYATANQFKHMRSARNKRLALKLHDNNEEELCQTIQFTELCSILECKEECIESLVEACYFAVNINQRTITNRNILSLVTTVKQLKVLLHHGLVISYDDLCNDVPFLTADILLYLASIGYNHVAILTHSKPSLQGEELTQKIKIARHSFETNKVSFLETVDSTRKLPTDILKLIVSYI